jgi:hypothetical protein
MIPERYSEVPKRSKAVYVGHTRDAKGCCSGYSRDTLGGALGGALGVL